jgi:sugar (pentulose or hexulose) kinase
MGIYLGLDLGTTTISAVARDASSGAALATVTLPNSAPRAPAPGRAEMDLATLGALATRALGDLAARLGPRSAAVAGLGVTGQMHGLALLAPDGTPLRPAITWQDERALLPAPPAAGVTAAGVTAAGAPADESILARFRRQAGGPAAFLRLGCLPAAGYAGVTLFALALEGALPPGPALACTVPDAVVSFLSGAAPHSDPTDAASTGLYDVVAGCWDVALVERLGLPKALLPPVRPSGTPAGPLRPAVAAACGLPAGLPVHTALGDNQAAYLGSVAVREGTLLLNVGTGAQISAWLPEFAALPAVETRPFPGGGYLLVGAGLSGGRSYALLAGLFRQAGEALCGARVSEATLYARLNALAAEVPPGADGLVCAPWFAGSRRDPALRASFSGITAANLTPGHLARALLEGLANDLAAFHAEMAAALPPPRRLVGAGNAVRSNGVLREALAGRFGLPLAVPACAEPAAAGAALLAAVGSGEVATLGEAMARVRYVEGEEED